MQYSVSTAIVQGEARVGKTCLKSLILSLPYESVSTSCIEAPHIAYGSFSINRYGSDDGKVWTLVTDDEIDEKVIAQLQDFMIRGNSSNERDDDTTPTNAKDSSSSGPDDDSIHNQKVSHDLKQVPADKPDDSAVRGSVPEVPVESDTGEASDETSKTAAVSHDVSRDSSFIDRKFDPLEYCRNTCNIEKMALHRQWLYFFDSGGQVQFQKLLLAFMPCPSALILVVNLSKKLSEPSSREMELPNNKKIIVDNFSLKVQDVLSQMISAVASKAQQHKLAKKDSDYIKYCNEKLVVLTVGTHRDILEGFINEGKEDIKEIERKRTELRVMLNSVSSTCTYDTKSPLYEIDGRKAGEPGKLDGDTNADTIEKISCQLKKQAHKIDVPLRWHYFGVILRKKASKSNGLLSRSECEFYGKMLEMNVDEVYRALQFFHELGMLFYYHESKANDIVFVKLDCLINIIRDLVIAVSDSLNLKLIELDSAKKDLRVRGYVSVEILKSSGAFELIAKQLFNGDHKYCFNKLTSLFQYLKIAAEVPGEEKFVMPALLPLKDPNMKLPFPHTKSSPLLFHFNSAVPMGFFCAIIVDLSDSKKIFIEEGSFSNFCTLKLLQSKCRYLKIALVEKLNCIEIHFDKVQHRLEVKYEVNNAINSVMKVLKLSEKPSPAFYCPCQEEGEHVATVNVNDSCGSSIECTLKQNVLELSVDEYDYYFSWFFTQEELKKSDDDKAEECKSIHLHACSPI